MEAIAIRLEAITSNKKAFGWPSLLIRSKESVQDGGGKCWKEGTTNAQMVLSRGGNNSFLLLLVRHLLLEAMHLLLVASCY